MKIRLILTVITLAAIAVVVLLGLNTVRQLERTNRQLVETALPLFEHIQSVKNKLNHQELLFYQYYLDGENRQFNKQLAETSDQIQRELTKMESIMGPSAPLREIQTSAAHLKTISRKFDTAMLPPTDWDEARAVLSEFTPIADSINQQSFALLSDINDKVRHNASASLNETEKGVGWIAAMSLMLFIAAVFLLLINKKLSQALREQKRLTAFPELNPDPVIAINKLGQVDYANPGARQLSQQLFQTEDTSLLLPDGLEGLMSRARNHLGNVRLEYDICGRTFSAELHWLADLAEYHLYLTEATAEKQAREKLAHMAYHQVLTGLPNRQQLEQSFEHRQAAFLVLLEIDRYQHIITSSGHATADLVIKKAAGRLRALIDQADVALFHLESNLFAILFDKHDEVTSLVNRVIAKFCEPIILSERHFYLSLSAGGVMLSPGDELFEALRKADSALRTVSSSGGNGYREFDDELDRLYLRKTALQNDLRHAARHEEFVIYMQPIYSAISGTMVGAEALIRWHRRRDEWVSPVEFIPVAEASGQIVMIGDWVIEQVFNVAKQWTASHDEPTNLAINISASHWENERLCDSLKVQLEKYRLEASLFTLEITEQAALQDIEKTITTMQTLKSLGFKLAIDDFGTGYSSLNYLHRLPVDKLKIDQSFVRQLEESGKNAAIVKSVIALAHQLKLLIVAEGVETKAQRETLAEWGCDQLQGYLLAKPMPAYDFLVIEQQ
ncbi:putative bifunctional diguanylate cyclase/phosphodiesterase [Methylophaga sp. OBS4]|uniref:putative bifunctional diguanylate cyclase/phosphodiesterase n=1 Tax=Methylophaga sp. OBS4 TaxID=2991935 RepID=UPI002257A491|nr:GGDEF domain-containing phosphodiesterase [Methylophaga sp. OBS4]MCX4186525.1 EAL domain-containing protein [Methylophaga sp. OBS4]